MDWAYNFVYPNFYRIVLLFLYAVLNSIDEQYSCPSNAIDFDDSSSCYY